MRGVKLLAACLYLAAAATVVVHAEDPYFHHVWNVTYGTASPLGVPQQVILINGQFPGPNINSTSNNNVIINVFNNLDEPFLLTWNGIQHRKNCWQDGTPGTMCPIMPGTNYTYHFQPKDQIGSYFYYPTTGMHRAAGGYGGLRVNSRLLIPVPYADPEDDYTVLIGDWYTKSHTQLKKFLDGGRTIGRPDGIVINGKSGKGDGSDAPLFTLKPERLTGLGSVTWVSDIYHFRIQNHKMKLVEWKDRTFFKRLRLSRRSRWPVLWHIVTANQEPKDYYMVASSRFLKTVITTTGLLRYEGGKGPASSQLPAGPVGWAWSLNQFRSFRWNLTASAARPNPQGSYHYGKINITRTIKLVNTQGKVDGKLRFALNGVSHTEPETPLKLAEYFGISDKVFKYDTITDDPTPEQIKNIKIEPNVLNITHRTFVEVVFENHEKSVQSWHLDGYSFFSVAVEPGTWTPEKRKNYNLLDAVSRHTVQVYPKCWAAILLTFDNCGMWNVRSENTERRYLGQQLYASVLSPEKSLRDEYNMPETSLQCGLVKNTPKPVNPYAGA
uniref:Sku5-like 11 n=1 Tax=Brassica campestris TaxID=3711 RepID=A8IXH9_BRACM|nr:Sku5-like 11 [Brassica rapa]